MEPLKVWPTFCVEDLSKSTTLSKTWPMLSADQVSESTADSEEEYLMGPPGLQTWPMLSVEKLSESTADSEEESLMGPPGLTKVEASDFTSCMEAMRLPEEMLSASRPQTWPMLSAEKLYDSTTSSEESLMGPPGLTEAEASAFASYMERMGVPESRDNDWVTIDAFTDPRVISRAVGAQDLGEPPVLSAVEMPSLTALPMPFMMPFCTAVQPWPTSLPNTTTAPTFLEPVLPMSRGTPLNMAMPATNDLPKNTAVLRDVPSATGQQSLSKPPGVFDKGASLAEQDSPTMMIRDLPEQSSRQSIMALLDSEGLRGLYNFLYLPRDLKTHKLFGGGVCFVNWVSHDHAAEAMVKFSGHGLDGRILRTAWVTKGCGLDAQISRLRNSRVMHPDVPDEFKPLLFRDGQPVPFPKPTEEIVRPLQLTRSD